jgi:hypothetical protein
MPKVSLPLPWNHQNVDKLLQVGLPRHKCRVTRHSPEAHRVTLPLVLGHLPNTLLGCRRLDRPQGAVRPHCLPWSFWWPFSSSSLISLYFIYKTPCKAYHNKCSSREWGPCVVRGPVDGRFLVWWVIDNVVWTDSWLSIAGAGCGLTVVGAGEEQARKVVAGEASRCGEVK